MPAPDSPYYQYTDHLGGTVITDKWESIPERYRESAEPIQVPGGGPEGLDLADFQERARSFLEKAQRAAESLDSGRSSLGLSEVDLPSAVLGFGFGMAVFLAWSLVFKTGRFIFRLGLFLLVIGLIGGGSYWIVESGKSLSDSVIEDARKAAEDIVSKLPSAP